MPPYTNRRPSDAPVKPAAHRSKASDCPPEATPGTAPDNLGPGNYWLVTIGWYDGRQRTLEIASQTAVWYHSGKPPVPIR